MKVIIALLSISLSALLACEKNQDSQPNPQHEASLVDQATTVVDNVEEKATDLAGDAGQQITEAADVMTKKTSDLAEQGKQAAAELVEESNEKLESAVNTVGEKVKATLEKVPAAATTTTAANDDLDQGKKIFGQSCVACHGTGVAGAPKLGDASWVTRLQQGKNTLVKHAIEGYQGKSGVMPAKGGNSSLSDEEINAAVTYMVSKK